MKVIKGLIIKDLLQLKSYKKTLFIFILIFFLSGLTQENINTTISTVILMITLAFGMFGIASFNYDEQAKADSYILTLPISKKDVLLAKYLLIIILTIIGALIGIILSIIISFLLIHHIPNILTIITTSISYIFALGIIESLQIPCIYKWGAEKGRLQLFVIVAVVALLLGAVVYIIKRFNYISKIQDILNSTVSYLPLLLLIIISFIYYISYKVSLKIYNKKEF